MPRLAVPRLQYFSGVLFPDRRGLHGWRGISDVCGTWTQRDITVIIDCLKSMVISVYSVMATELVLAAVCIEIPRAVRKQMAALFAHVSFRQHYKDPMLHLWIKKQG